MFLRERLHVVGRRSDVEEGARPAAALVADPAVLDVPGRHAFRGQRVRQRRHRGDATRSARASSHRGSARPAGTDRLRAAAAARRTAASRPRRRRCGSARGEDSDRGRVAHAASSAGDGEQPRPGRAASRARARAPGASGRAPGTSRAPRARPRAGAPAAAAPGLRGRPAPRAARATRPGRSACRSRTTRMPWVSRSRSKRSGSGKRRSSRLAEPISTQSLSPCLICAPPSATSLTALRNTSWIGASQRKVSSIAAGTSAGSAATRAAASGCFSSACTVFPIRLVVVSFPATRSSETNWNTSRSDRPFSPSCSRDDRADHVVRRRAPPLRARRGSRS